MSLISEFSGFAFATSEDVNSKIEFDCPFRVVGQAQDGRTIIESSLEGVHAPEVTLWVDSDGNAVHQEYIDDVLWSEPQKTWEAVNGYSGQQGYRGPTMHASEFLGGRMAKDVLADAGGVYVAVTVECLPNWEIDEDDDNDVAQGQDIQNNPAGWMLLKLK